LAVVGAVGLVAACGRIGFDATDRSDGGEDRLCGNGTLDTGEQCDDDNLQSDDGCSERCEIESGFCVRPGTDPADRDDDGIPNARDPSPDTCDPALTFESPPSPDTWGGTFEPEGNGLCGAPGATASADLGAAAPSLIEVRFRLGPIQDATSWDVRLTVSGPDGTGACSVLLSQSIDAMFGGSGTRVRMGAETTSGGWGNFPTHAFDAADGRDVVIQFRHDASVPFRCLFFDSTTQLDDLTPPNGFPVPTFRATLAVATSGRSACMKSVRVLP